MVHNTGIIKKIKDYIKHLTNQSKTGSKLNIARFSFFKFILYIKYVYDYNICISLFTLRDLNLYLKLYIII